LVKTADALAREVFYLMYFGKFSFLDIFVMPTDLRLKLAEILMETKEEERKAREEAEKEIESQINTLK